MQRTRLNVLCVEDDAEALATLQRALEDAGYSVVAVTEGAAGLDLLLAGGFDIAIVDIGLPFMNGYQLARGAREILGDATPPLVAVTGFARAEDQEEAGAAGFAVHLAKPVSFPNLLRTIETLTNPEQGTGRGKVSHP